MEACHAIVCGFYTCVMRARFGTGLRERSSFSVDRQSYLRSGDGERARTFQFLLDTGAPDFTLSIPTMNATNARVNGTTQASGVGEHTDTAYKTHVKSLKLADAEWQNLDGQALNFGSLNTVIGFTALDGVAGKPVFDRFVVDFDFASSTLRLIAPRAIFAGGERAYRAVCHLSGFHGRWWKVRSAV